MYLGFWYLFNCPALSILVLATQGHVGRHIAEINRLDRREVNHPLHLSVLYPSLLQIFGECRNELAASIVELYRKMKSIARSMLADGGAKEIPQPAYSPHDSPMRFHHVWLVTLYCSQGVCDQVTGQDEVHVVACDHGKGATYIARLGCKAVATFLVVKGTVKVFDGRKAFSKMGLLLPPQFDGGPGLIERLLQALYTGSPSRMAGKSGSSGSSGVARALLRLRTGGAMLAMDMIASWGKENAETWRETKSDEDPMERKCKRNSFQTS
ncbi:hypothetical protein BKA59DRAFT_459721 [Fusarium tricinctum]|uniref:Uncharacterized protein n=1 Tax=Fusarium tricinctum TaxID=61284 RepID=A0A8K0RR46_9HYPO|nr:hypothetical protein BKA59DRAFT_459721 [Fusarium tricinctum]